MQTAQLIEFERPFPPAGNRPAHWPRSGVDAYTRTFGEAVPVELLCWAAHTGQADWLEQLLAERIERTEPVSDWHAFARPLVEPMLGIY